MKRPSGRNAHFVRSLLASFAAIAALAACGTAERPIQATISLPAELGGDSGGEPLFIRVEALALDEEDPDLAFGNPDKPVLTSLDVVPNESVFDPDSDCDFGPLSNERGLIAPQCQITLRFPIPSGVPLEIRAYLVQTFSGEYAPYNAAFYNAMLYGAAPFDGEGSDLAIDLAYWDDSFMPQPPPPAPLGTGTGPGLASLYGYAYFDTSGLVTQGCDPYSSWYGGSPTADFTSLVAYDADFASMQPPLLLPYTMINAGDTGDLFGAPDDDGGQFSFDTLLPAGRSVFLFGVYTGFGQFDDYDLFAGDSWQSSNGPVDTFTDHIGTYGQSSGGVLLDTSASPYLDVVLTDCPKARTVDLQVFEESPPYDLETPVLTPLPFGSPASPGANTLLGAADDYFGGEGSFDLNYSTAPYAYYYYTGGVNQFEGPAALSVDVNNYYYTTGGIGATRGATRGAPSAPDPFNRVEVPTFQVPYPGGALYPQSGFYIDELVDPNDPGVEDLNAWRVGSPLSSNPYDYYGYYSYICDPAVTTDCYWWYDAVEYDQVDVVPSTTTGVAQLPARARARRPAAPGSCGLYFEGTGWSILFTHPNAYAESSGASYIMRAILEEQSSGILYDASCNAAYAGYLATSAAPYTTDPFIYCPYYQIYSAFSGAAGTYNVTVAQEYNSTLGPSWGSPVTALNCTVVP